MDRPEYVMSEIRILKPGDEEKLEEFLLPRIDESMFLLSNMRDAGLDYNGNPYEGTYAASFDPEGNITGVVAHYWNGNLMFNAPESAGKLWRSAVQASGRAIEGLIGPDRHVETAVSDLDLTEAMSKMFSEEILYSLELNRMVEPEPLRSGTAAGRKIRDEDVDILTEWRTGYEVETIGAKDTPELRSETRERVKRLLTEKRGWILHVQGNPVSTCGFNAAVAEAVQLGGVWTPAEHRSKGYARSVVAAALSDARADGVPHAILFTGLDNIPAQKAYESLGFERIGNYRIILLKEPLPWKGSENT